MGKKGRKSPPPHRGRRPLKTKKDLQAKPSSLSSGHDTMQSSSLSNKDSTQPWQKPIDVKENHSDDETHIYDMKIAWQNSLPNAKSLEKFDLSLKKYHTLTKTSLLANNETPFHIYFQSSSEFQSKNKEKLYKQMINFTGGKVSIGTRAKDRFQIQPGNQIAIPMLRNLCIDMVAFAAFKEWKSLLILTPPKSEVKTMESQKDHIGYLVGETLCIALSSRNHNFQTHHLSGFEIFSQPIPASKASDEESSGTSEKWDAKARRKQGNWKLKKRNPLKKAVREVGVVMIVDDSMISMTSMLRMVQAVQYFRPDVPIVIGALYARTNPPDSAAFMWNTLKQIPII